METTLEITPETKIEDIEQIQDTGVRSEKVREYAILQQDMQDNPDKYKVQKVEVINTEEKKEKDPDNKDKTDKEKDVKAAEVGSDGAPDKKDTTDKVSTPDKGDTRLDIEKYAEENKLSLDDARKEVESIEKIQKKYGSDVNKMSKAMLSALRVSSKLQQELKKVQESGKKQFDFDSQEYVVWEGKTIPKDKLVKEWYEKKFPAHAEKYETDEEKFEAAKQIMIANYQAVQKKDNAELVEKARDKRVVVINGVPDDDYKFIDDIKEIVDNTDDRIVLQENYDLEPTLCMARGRHYHKDLKEAEENGYKRGLAEAKIKNKESERPAGETVDDNETHGLSQLERLEAETMFANHKGISKQEKYKIYKEKIKKGE